jgi:uncharacterized membrane protein
MATATSAVRTRPPTRQVHQPRQETRKQNVGEAERLLSVLGGGALTLFGLTRGSLGGLALAGVGCGFVCRGVAGHCMVYEFLGVNTAEPRGPATSVPAARGVKVRKSVTIDRSPEDLYRFWRDFENLPRVMSHLESVKDLGNRRSHWVARAPLGTTVEWDAEVITERLNELIGWRSLEGSTVSNAGSVHFTRAPAGGGTLVEVELKYNPPAGKTGAALARLLGEAPELQIEEDLRHFKQLMEAGAVPATGQPSGRRR